MQKTEEQVISQQTKHLIDKLLLGKFSLTEVAKITGISEEWIQSYVDSLYKFAL